MQDQEARPPRRWRKAAAALLAILALMLIGLWSQRKPIARGFVDRELRARGVPARYTITGLGPFRQRLENVVIGDPARPDLTARSMDLEMGYGFGAPRVRRIVARGVRLRAGWGADGLTLGAIDRLMPKPTGAPFTLPDISIDMADTEIALATPAGPIKLALAGAGGLTDGFAGTLSAKAPTLAMSGCDARQPSARLVLRIARRQPRLEGPVSATRISCGDVVVDQPRIDLATKLAETLVPLTGGARIAARSMMRRDDRFGPTKAAVTFDGQNPHDMHGTLEVAAGQVRAAGYSAGELGLDARYRIGGRLPTASGATRPVRGEGTVTLKRGNAGDAFVDTTAALARAVIGTPIEPLARKLAGAVAQAGRSASGSARFEVDGDVVERRGGTGFIGLAKVPRVHVVSASGARLDLAGGEGLRVAWPTRSIRLSGGGTLAGGGFPGVRIQARQSAVDGALDATMAIDPYEVDGARLALSPIRLSSRDGVVRFATGATIDGPLGDGRVTGLSAPLSGVIGNEIVVNTACVPLSFASLSIAGVDLGRTRLPICPVGGAMVRVANGRAGGGMRIPRPRLAGRVGRQPLTIAADELRTDIGRSGFVAYRMAVRLGGEDGTQLDVDRLDGRIGNGGVGGRFTATSGKIVNVPLLLSDGEGRWRLAGGRLGLAGRVAVADADAMPRFNRLVAPDLRLDLTGGVISATGTLREPKSNLAISDVTIRHDLSRGAGQAVLDMPGITFGPAFQPEVLTRLTLGVIANVEGTVRGQGRIGWGDTVVSTGVFTTDGMNLAAAFGPVTGLKGTIEFDDLLGLRTPPGQVATVDEVNPGIAVPDGVLRYQLLDGLKVAVEDGRWPFSGGDLVLEPTVLDFGQPVDRRMTFRVTGMDAGKFIDQFDFKNLDASGTFDGVLPMIFNERGGRISGGRLVVRPGGGTLAYVGELTNEDLGTFGKLAFDALKAIRYDNLAIELDGALDGEIVSRIVFTGVNENPAPGKEARGLLRNLTGLPFKFNITVRAPFRGLTSSAQAFTNPGALIRGAAQPPVAGAPAVQPPLSEDKL